MRANPKIDSYIYGLHSVFTTSIRVSIEYIFVKISRPRPALLEYQKSNALLLRRERRTNIEHTMESRDKLFVITDCLPRIQSTPLPSLYVSLGKSPLNY